MKILTFAKKLLVYWPNLATPAVVAGVLVILAVQQSVPQTGSKNTAVLQPKLYHVAHKVGKASSASQPTSTVAQPDPPKPNPATPTAPPNTALASQNVQAASTKPVNQPTLAAKPVAPPVVTPNPPVSDIATEAVCPGQSSTTNTVPVLVCMASYARSQHGLAAVSANSSLMQAAAAKAQDMFNCGYSHTACGHPFNYWFSVKGYTGRCSAENIAEGQLSPGEVFTAWMNSPGHRANILNASYLNIGVAEATSSNGYLWVMELGGC